MTERQLTGVFMEAMADAGRDHAGDPGRRLDHLAGAPWRGPARPRRGGRRPGRLRCRRGRRRLRRRGRPHLAGRPRRRHRRSSCPSAGTTLWARLLDALPARRRRPSDLLDAYEAAGEPLPADAGRPRPRPGLRRSVVDPRPARPPPPSERLEPGMVLVVTGYVWEQGVGAVVRHRAGASSPPTGPRCCRRVRSASTQELSDMTEDDVPTARGDHPLREGPRDQDRDDHAQPARPAQHRRPSAMRLPVRRPVCTRRTSTTT